MSKQNFSKNKNLQQATKFFFVLSLFIITFSIIDAFFRWFEVVEFTLLSPLIWLVVLLITLLLLGVSEKWKKFFLILFLGIGNFVFFVYVLLSASISQEKPIKNTNYFIEANMHQYRIKVQNCCYKKVIATKSSNIFFTPNMKTGIVPLFEAKLLSETPEILILEIKASGKPIVKDTIRKLEN